jgi:hypothetical protein
MKQMTVLATMAVMVVLGQACASGGQIGSVELTPAPTTPLRPSDVLKAKFQYQIPGYSARDEYWAQMMFEAPDAQHTRSAPRPYGYQQVRQADGEVELEVPVSVLLGPPWGLTSPLKVWLYVNRRTQPRRSEPVLRAGPFVFTVERTTSQSPPN